MDTLTECERERDLPRDTQDIAVVTFDGGPMAWLEEDEADRLWREFYANLQGDRVE
jgi:hypothetical protein